MSSIVNFGKGIFTVSAYETAFVGRIPSAADGKVAAFPQSVEWLRQNQLPDGSWGSLDPKSSYNNLLSTACALVCLKEWNSDDDQGRIASGVQAIKLLVEDLDDPISMTIGFELIYPSLVDRASELGIDLSCGLVSQMKKVKQAKLYQFSKLKKRYDKTGVAESALTSLLEGLEPIFDKHELKDLADDQGIIGHSYSATAFAVMRDPTLILSLDAIRRTVDMNSGGVPAYCPLEVFALSWSLGFVCMAGLDISGFEYKPFVDTLESYWMTSNGHLGGSLTLERDADDTANALFALNSAGRQIGPENCKNVLGYFKDNHFFTYEYEMTPSLSTNLHCLMALKRYKDIDDINSVIQKTLCWIRSMVTSDDKFLFRDKWHLSPFYPLSRAVLALHDIDDLLFGLCVDSIIDMQNRDGGWGRDGISSLEETSYAVLALSFAVKVGHKRCPEEALQKVNEGKAYIELNKAQPLKPLWITKSLYCLTDTVQTIIYSAQESRTSQ